MVLSIWWVLIIEKTKNMEKYLVYLNLDQLLSPILCDSMADAEELILSLTQEQMYENYCWYICNDIDPPRLNKLVQKRFHTETIYGAYLLKYSGPIYIIPVFTY